MNIQEWLRQQEGDHSLTMEQFYARLKSAIIELQDRLACAKDDGVDLNEIDPEDD